MFLAPTGVAGLVHRWAKFYDDRTSVSTAVTFVHLAGILLAGGFAIVADRASLRLSPTGDMDQMHQLDEIASVHRWVIIGLVVTFVSGILMFFSDLNTYMHSAVFWTKMGLIVLLLGNGYVRMRAEAALRRGVAVWRRFRQTSIASLALWFAVLLAGTILQNS